MYSYNNIVAKPPPPHAEVLNTLVLDTESFHSLVHSGAAQLPRLNASWRWVDANGIDGAASTAADLQPSDEDVIVVDHFLSDVECRAIIECCEQLGFTFWADTTQTASPLVDRDDCTRAEASSAAPRLPQDSSASMPIGKPADECEGHTTNVNPTAASVTEKPSSSFRTAFTVEVHLAEFAARLWERFCSCTEVTSRLRHTAFTPDMERAEAMYERDLEGGVWEPIGVCDNLLFARYQNGGHFAPHVDGSHVLDVNTRTMYTALIYLNDCTSGGETFLLKGDQCDVLVLDETSGKFVGRSDARIGAVEPRTGRVAVFYHNVLHEGAPVGPCTSNGTAASPAPEKYIIRADILYRRNPPILTGAKDVEAFQMYQEARILESSGFATEAASKFRAIRRLSPGVAALYQLD